VTSLGVNMMVWKRCRRHDGTQDLDTSEHDRRELLHEPESAMRCFRISSRTSFGILESCGVLPETTGTVSVPVAVGMDCCLAFDCLEPIPSRDGGIRLEFSLESRDGRDVF